MEVLTTAEMERADRLTIAAGTPGFALMQSAGQAVAEAAMDLVEEGPILVVAGRGNNGGDGFVAAAELAARGRDVSVILLCERDSLKGDAALAARGWRPVLPFDPQAIGKPALIIDALFGAGLDRPVKGDPLEMIEAINTNGAPVLARRPAERHQRHDRRGDGRCDQRRGDRDVLPPEARRICCCRGGCIAAASRRRYRHRSPRARRDPAADVRELPQGWQESFPVPRIDGHKYARGHALVVSGGMASTGAARLAARGGAAGRGWAGDAWRRRAMRLSSMPRH